MGCAIHHAIIVSGVDPAALAEAHIRAVNIFADNQISSVVNAPCNGWRTFFVGPDGSNEGWKRSEDGDKQRDAFIEYLKKRPPGKRLVWCEVQYFCEDGAAPAVLRDGSFS